MNDEWNSVRKSIIISYKRPQLEDAVRLCKIAKITSVQVLFEVFEKLLVDHANRRDMTGSYE